MHDVKDWAEVHRLFHRERWSKTAIAEKLEMSRNTVDRLLGLDEPPRYERVSRGSALDRFDDDIVAMLTENPKAPATVILERLRPLGYAGGITVLKERHVLAAPGDGRGEELSANELSARRDRPAGLVAHRLRGPGRQGHLPGGVRAGGDVAAFGCARNVFHVLAEPRRISWRPRSDASRVWVVCRRRR